MERETRALALLARIIGRRQGVEVRFSARAETASTDGKTITLPLVANLGTDQHAVLVEGLLDHEAMHCRFTDFAVIPGQGEPIVAELHNLLEDVWGEREQAKIYPGCARNIRKAMDVMIDLGWYRGPRPGSSEPPAMALTNFLLAGLLARLYECSRLKSFAEEYRAVVSGLLGEDLVDRIWKTACRVDQVFDTTAALQLAREIVGLLREAAMDLSSLPGSQGRMGKPAQLGADGSGGGASAGNEGQGGQGGARPSGNGTAEGASSGETPREPGAPGGADGSVGRNGTGRSNQTGAGAGDGPGQSQGAGDGSGGGSSAAQVAQDILAASQDQMGQGDMGHRIVALLKNEGKVGQARNAFHAAMDEATGMAGGAANSFPMIKPVDTMGLDHSGYHGAAMAMARSIEVKLGTRLEALLEAKKDSFEVHKRSGRKLATRRTPRIALGRLDVFRSVEEAEEVNTAVQVLLDCSTSMQVGLAGNPYATNVPAKDSRLAAAAAVTFACAQVLDRHEVPFEVHCFGSQMSTIKRFDDCWRRARRFSMTERRGGTMTDCALLRVSPALEAREESRRIIVLVTDGLPHDVTSTIAVMNELRQLGIEFSLLFIGGDGCSMETHLRSDGYHVARADTPDKLASSFFEAVQRAF